MYSDTRVDADTCMTLAIDSGDSDSSVAPSMTVASPMARSSMLAASRIAILHRSRPAAADGLRELQEDAHQVILFEHGSSLRKPGTPRTVVITRTAEPESPDGRRHRSVQMRPSACAPAGYSAA